MRAVPGVNTAAATRAKAAAKEKKRLKISNALQKK